MKQRAGYDRKLRVEAGGTKIRTLQEKKKKKVMLVPSFRTTALT